MIGVSKHLCGAATDLALRSLANFAQESPNKIKTILIALCCHHRCDYGLYVAPDFLHNLDFKPEEFGLLCGLTSWATCGTGKPRDNADRKRDKDDIIDKSDEKEDAPNPHVDRYERLRLPREQREEIGRRTKRVLDLGRCEFVREKLGISRVKLAFYVDAKHTLENVVLIADND